MWPFNLYMNWLKKQRELEQKLKQQELDEQVAIEKRKQEILDWFKNNIAVGVEFTYLGIRMIPVWYGHVWGGGWRLQVEYVSNDCTKEIATRWFSYDLCQELVKQGVITKPKIEITK